MAFSITGSTPVNTSGNSLIFPLEAFLDHGLSINEYSNTPANVQRAIFAMLKALQNPTLQGVVGITRTALGQTLVGQNLINNTFSWSFDRLANLSANTVGQIPLPTVGSNSGNGGFALADIFAALDVRVVANNTAVTDALIMPLSDLTPLGYTAPVGSLDPLGDDRLFYRALFQYLTSSSQFAVRVQGTLSSITTRTVSSVSLVGLPANATAETNPTTGVNPADTVAVLRQNYTVTFQQRINQATDAVDINFI